MRHALPELFLLPFVCVCVCVCRSDVLARIIDMPGHSFEYKRHDSKLKGHHHSSGRKADEDEEDAPAPAPAEEHHKEKRPARPHWSVDDGKTGYQTRPYKAYSSHGHGHSGRTGGGWQQRHGEPAHRDDDQ